MQESQVIQVPKTEGDSGEEELQPQYILATSDGNEVILGDGKTINASQLGSLVQQGATVQEVQVVDGGQEVTYTYTTADGNEILAIGGEQEAFIKAGDVEVDEPVLIEEDMKSTDGKVDQSFKYYDNIRGKIDNDILKGLIETHHAENPELSKNDRLRQWNFVTRDYCRLTGQQKSRTSLMKKWASSRHYNGQPSSPEGIFGGPSDGPATSAVLKSDSNIPKRHFKTYDLIKLEAVKLERDAQKVLHENAIVEGEKLKKEAEILDTQLETVKLELEIKKAEAAKKGIVIQEDQIEFDLQE